MQNASASSAVASCTSWVPELDELVPVLEGDQKGRLKSLKLEWLGFGEPNMHWLTILSSNFSFDVFPCVHDVLWDHSVAKGFGHFVNWASHA